MSVPYNHKKIDECIGLISGELEWYHGKSALRL